MSRFLPQTEEGLREILDNLREAKDTMTQTEFNLAQQSVGINYEAACLLYSPMAEIARVPTTRFPDWFHNLLASGGVLQYQVNHLCMELRKIGMTPEHLDDFPVVLPRGHTRLPKAFFERRVVFNRNKHIRAFGSEMLSAIAKLSLFVLVVVEPTGALPRCRLLLQIARLMVELLCLGDAVLAEGRLATLEAAQQAHHELFLEVIPWHAKPKLHTNRHGPGAM